MRNADRRKACIWLWGDRSRRSDCRRADDEPAADAAKLH
jgi:hypothetical protein